MLQCSVYIDEDQQCVAMSRVAQAGAESMSLTWGGIADGEGALPELGPCHMSICYTSFTIVSVL